MKDSLSLCILYNIKYTFSYINMRVIIAARVFEPSKRKYSNHLNSNFDKIAQIYINNGFYNFPIKFCNLPLRRKAGFNVSYSMRRIKRYK